MSLKPRLGRQQAVAALLQAPQSRFAVGLVEPHQHVAGFDKLTFRNHDLANDAALEMLDLLVLAGRDKGA